MQQAQIVAAATGHYLHVGVIRISVTNLAIIVAMIIIFLAAMVVPFPHHGDDEGDQS